MPARRSMRSGFLQIVGVLLRVRVCGGGAGAQMIGDVVICMQRAVEQAKMYDHSLQREVGYLTAHSLLHLLGYDHEKGGMEAVRMREKEEVIMEQLGLPASASYVME